MTSVAVHLACILAVAVDLGTRTIRLQWFARAAGAGLAVRDAFVTTSFGDAAAALTPWRAAGEPARVLGMTRGGATVGQSIVALTAESIMNYLIVIAFSIPLAVAFGSDYWSALPSLGAIARTTLIVVGIVSVVLLTGWIVFGHHASALIARATTAWKQAIATLRFSPRGLISMGVLASALSLCARVAVLPLLALDTVGRPSLGVLALASFTLLYGQLVVPSPSGAGVIDVAVLSGAAAVHDGTGALLAAWRFYTTLLPTAVGIVAALWQYGPSAFAVFRRKQ